MPIKMIVTDLDGTLLRSDSTMSEYTQAVLSKCRRLGVKIVYATGRGKSAERVAPTEFFDGKITSNGAIGRIGDDIVCYRLIPCQVARPILVACDRRGMKILSHIDGMHYSNFIVSDQWPQISNYKIVDFLHHDMDAEKLYMPNPMLDERKFIEQLLPDDLYFIVISYEDGFLGQIMHRDATKAKAIYEIAQRWGISQSEIVAFGNDYNDIEMLQECGIGIVVSNAADEIKNVADFVCDTNDNDGVAKWIEENLCKGGGNY